MTAALSWLNDIAAWLGRWVPRMVLIEPTHRGVRFGPRGSAREVGPGLVVYWPITHALHEVAITTRSIQLSAQLLPYDGAADSVIPRVTVCAAAIQFRTEDAVKAATRVLNIHALVDNRACAAIARHLDHRASPNEWAAVVLEELKAELRPYGVIAERLDFTQNGVGVALKQLSDWNYTDNVTGTRPT